MSDLERAARAANECYQTHGQIGHLRSGEIAENLAAAMQRAALRALLPPSDEAVRVMVTAARNAGPSGLDQYTDEGIARTVSAAITAYITFIAGERS